MSLSVLEHVSLKKYSTFHIGGLARFLAEVKNEEELCSALDFAYKKSLPILRIGHGSNSLFHDEGFCGLALVNRMMDCRQQEEGVFQVGAGFSFSQLGRLTAKEGWGGLEFASGIPASIGGAVYMNAGAQGQETKDCLVSVTSMTPDAQIHTYAASDLQFGYRFSAFHAKEDIICSAVFQLERREGAWKDLQDKVGYRMKTQPYLEKSIGCIFKNPEGNSAGRLIEAAGLKGACCGDACVSTVHANFIINKHEATARDVCTLIQRVVSEVQKRFQVTLETEVRLIDTEGKNVQIV